MAPKRKAAPAAKRPAKKTRTTAKTEVADKATIKVEVIDEDGDLLIKFDKKDGQSRQRYLRVSRHTLCLSSKVFKAMLSDNSPFLEGASNSNKGTALDGTPSVKLMDDDYNAMLILMNVIHLKGSSVPQCVPFPLLDALAVSCDKYDMRASLGPWPGVWARRYFENFEQAGRERLLFIATAFQFGDVLPAISEHLMFTSKLAKGSGELVGPEGDEFIEGVPDTFLGTLTLDR